MTEANLSTRLIIVEDEAVLALGMEDALLAAGHHVVGVADDYETALALAPLGPEIALVDVNLLRGSSGVDVARELTRRGILCLFVTGNCPPEAGGAAAGCLEKPFTDRALVQAVEVAVALARAVPAPPAPVGMRLFGR